MPLIEKAIVKVVEEAKKMVSDKGRKMDIHLEIVTPEKAIVRIPVRLDQTIGSIKETLAKQDRYYILDDMKSTKKCAIDSKKFETTLSAIYCKQPIMRFGLISNDSSKKDGSKGKSGIHQRDYEGGAFDSTKTFEYYDIQNNARLYYHLEFTIEIICYPLMTKIKTNGFALHNTLEYPLNPRLHIKCKPTDTVGFVKKQCYEYLKNVLKKGYETSEDSLAEKETKYRLD